MFSITAIAVCVLVLLVFKFINIPQPPRILGIYQQPNKFFYFKYAFMYVILLAKNIFHRLKWRLAVETGKSCDGTIHVHNSDTVLEQLHDLGPFPKSVDAVYFNGTSKNKEAVICGVARRPAGVCNAFLYLKLQENELLLSPELPQSTLKQTSAELFQYSVAGITINNLMPMRSWKLQYKGEMKPRNDPAKRLQVELDLTWSTKWNRFNFSTDMSPSGMARDMARETWGTDYFKLLHKMHQNHYQQMGMISGTAIVDGKQHTLSMECVRDHTFGKHREWLNFHRYVMHFIYLENGDSMCVLSACIPISFSHLSAGYVCRNADHAVYPINSCSFELYRHGERKIPPRDYAFDFTAGGQTYIVQVLVQDEDTFLIGEENEAKIYERWVTYEVNGIKGWGCVEWQYRNVD